MKNLSEIAVVMTVRKNSTRCKNKLLRNYAGTTLFDIALQKISKIKGHDVFICAYEQEFKQKIKKYNNINFIERSKLSANISGEKTSDVNILFEMYNKIHHKWIFWINPCHAFLKLETINNAIKKFATINNKSMTSVVEYYGWFYNNDGAPLNNFKASTGVDDDYLYIGAHAFHAYKRIMPLVSNKVWDNVKGDPFLYPINTEEAYDINTEQEFLVSEFIHKNKK